MANIIIAGNSYTVISSLSLSDLETIKKYRPAALTLIDEETKEPYFKIGTGSSSINSYGINFGGVTNDTDRLATATLPIPSDAEDAKMYVLDSAGMAIANLNKLEAAIADALDEIRAVRDTVAVNITVII